MAEVDRALRPLAVTVVLALGVFTLRRGVLLAAALRQAAADREKLGDATPTVAVVVPARDEAAVADRLLRTLKELDYPADRLSFVLVCDGCRDETPAIFRRWAAQRPNAQVLEVEGGKATALNAGLALMESEIVLALDADLRPRADLLRRLVAAFADDDVAAAVGVRVPGNADTNVVARYAALNSFVHDAVTSAGKDQLGLNPPAIGVTAYRRHALTAIGGFRPTSIGEDVEASLALTRAGWSTRLVRDAIAEDDVPETLRDYWHQHLRWTRATLEAARPRGIPQRACATRRIESWFVAAGNLDRLVLASAAVLAAARALPRWLPAAYLTLPALNAVAALSLTGYGRRLPAFAVSAAAMFPVDVAASIAAAATAAARRPPGWHLARAVGRDPTA